MSDIANKNITANQVAELIFNLVLTNRRGNGRVAGKKVVGNDLALKSKFLRGVTIITSQREVISGQIIPTVDYTASGGHQPLGPPRIDALVADFLKNQKNGIPGGVVLLQF